MKWLPIHRGGAKITRSPKMDAADAIALSALARSEGVSENRIIKTGLHQIPEFRQALKETEREREAYERNRTTTVKKESKLEKAVRKEAGRVR